MQTRKIVYTDFLNEARKADLTSLKSAIKKETFMFLQLLAACSMITKELSTRGLQIFQCFAFFSP